MQANQAFTNWYQEVTELLSLRLSTKLTSDVPAFATDRVTSLGDIAMYTDADEVPLWEVLDSVSKKEEGKPSSFNYKKAPAAELHDYFAEVLPNYDRDRVHDSDIKKLLQWYNILAKYGITDFKATLAPTEGENVDDRAEQVAE